MKRVGLIVVVCLVIAVILALAMPKRRNLVFMRARGQVEVAEGCTVFSPGIFDDEDRFEEATKKVVQIQRDGPIALYDTPIGSIWHPADSWTVPVLVEQSQLDRYHLRSSVKRGDVVIDVGAGIGVTVESALAAGAGTVVAVEPEPLSLHCLQRNLSANISDKRVIVVPKGAWDKEDTLPLYTDAANLGAASFVWRNAGRTQQVPVTTIDRLVADLHLPKVDLIKIHAEGAEKQVLLGATGTIHQYHPRLSIALEHSMEDAKVLPATARQLWPAYHVEFTSCVKSLNRVHPGVAVMFP